MELEEAPISVYKLGATYYVKLPVAFIPADIRNDDYLIYNMGIFVGRGEEFTYPGRRMDLLHISHKHQTKPETFYAVLTEEQFRLACQPWGKFDTPPVNKESFAFVPAAELNLDGAKKLISKIYMSILTTSFTESFLKKPQLRFSGTAACVKALFIEAIQLYLRRRRA